MKNKKPFIHLFPARVSLLVIAIVMAGILALPIVALVPTRQALAAPCGNPVTPGCTPPAAAPGVALPGAPAAAPRADAPAAGDVVGKCGEKVGGDQPATPAAAPAGATYCTPFNETNPALARGSDNGNEFIRKYVTPTIKALSALAGIAVAASVVFGGIQYATAGGDSGKVAAAKKRILEAVFILLAYIFFYAFMRWLLPGGIPG